MDHSFSISRAAASQSGNFSIMVILDKGREAGFEMR
jgi:hypothetical protein